MNGNDESADVFAIPDLWKASTWLENSQLPINDQNPLFSLNIDKITSRPTILAEELETLPELDEDLFFHLPPLLQEHDARGRGSASVPDLDSSWRSERGPSANADDLWLSYDHTKARPPDCKSWEQFHNQDAAAQPPLLFTEAGPAAVDALLSSQERSACGGASSIVATAVYCSCLLALALGRSSILFFWDDDNKSFVKRRRVRISGVSLVTLQGIDRLCLECANSTRLLRAFADGIHTSSSSGPNVSAAPTPARVALAGAVDQIILGIQAELGNRAQRNLRSILQLQTVVRPVQSVLSHFANLVMKLLAHSGSDEQMLSLLFREAQAAEYRGVLVQEAAREVLRLVSRPWTDFVEEWIGLRPEQGIPITRTRGQGKSFVRVGNKAWVEDAGYDQDEPEFFLDQDRMPAFVPQDIGHAIFETGCNLRFVREHHPDHPLVRQDVFASIEAPRLEWQFEWDAILEGETMAKEYERAFSEALQATPKHKTAQSHIQRLSSPGAPEFHVFGIGEEQITQNLLASIKRLDQLPRSHVHETKLSSLLQDGLFRDDQRQERLPPQHKDDNKLNQFSPHWSLVPLLSFGPTIAAQARIVNHECVKLLFGPHRLRDHIHLQRQFHLLSNGVFCSRLSHALFDPDLDRAERQAGVALSGGVMGLRLNSGRETWPPASSELRLALMGVLADSYQPHLPKISAAIVTSRDGSRAAAAAMTRRSMDHTPALVSSAPSREGASGGSACDLPGDLSFAVRDLSPEEIERCIDPNGLEALDFLRLSYKPPTSLRPIMTPAVLAKYDRIFRLLLRLLRMLYVVDQLSRDVSPSPARNRKQEKDGDGATDVTALLFRFRFEAHHFVTQIAAYFLGTATAGPWGRFEAWMDGVQEDLLPTDSKVRQHHHQQQQQHPRRDHPPGSAPNLTSTSPDAIRERHERALDDIASALLLRKRQAPVMQLLEDIFAKVLRFAKMVRLRRARRARGPGRDGTARQGILHVADEVVPGAEDYRKLHAEFRKKVEVFITVCRALSERRVAPGDKRKEEESDGGGGITTEGGDSTIERLLLMLDMSGYYRSKKS